MTPISMPSPAYQSNPADADAGAGIAVMTKMEMPKGMDDRGTGGLRGRRRDSMANLKAAGEDTYQKAPALKGMNVSTRQLNIPNDLDDGEQDAFDVSKQAQAAAQEVPHRRRIPGRRKSAMTVRTLDDSLRSSQSSGGLSQSVHIRREMRRSSFLLNLSMHSAPAGPVLLPPDEGLAGSPPPRAISANPSNKSDFAVKFRTVEVREFPITLGDNPSVSVGPPFTIDWKPQEIYDPVDLEEYESTRPPRRDYLQMVIPSAIRKDTLVKSGFTHQQIVTGCRDLNFEKTRRKKSQEIQHLDGLYEGLEKAKRGLRNMINKSRKKKERELLEKSMDVEKELEKERAAAWAAEEEMLAARISSSGDGDGDTGSSSSLMSDAVAEVLEKTKAKAVVAVEDGL